MPTVPFGTGSICAKHPKSRFTQGRVQAVGPERFGIVAVDCAKARSKWMLCDFYGRVLIPPTVVEHQRTAVDLATLRLQEALQEHGLQDHPVSRRRRGHS